jgi:methylated-DNA-[protein]-cysteine S-methyltransferase
MSYRTPPHGTGCSDAREVAAGPSRTRRDTIGPAPTRLQPLRRFGVLHLEAGGIPELRKETNMSTPATHPTVVHDTPIGPLSLSASDAGITRVRFRATAAETPSVREAGPERAWQWLDQARRQLDEYFAGTLTRFTVPIDLRRLDPERRAVLEALAHGAEHGETTTYGALAGAVGLTEDGPRRVGVAMARNPVPILVACHRVIGANGKLTGYAGGLEIKQTLLDLESRDRRPAQLALSLTYRG